MIKSPRRLTPKLLILGLLGSLVAVAMLAPSAPATAAAAVRTNLDPATQSATPHFHGVTNLDVLTAARDWMAANSSTAECTGLGAGDTEPDLTPCYSVLVAVATDADNRTDADGVLIFFVTPDPTPTPTPEPTATPTPTPTPSAPIVTLYPGTASINVGARVQLNLDSDLMHFFSPSAVDAALYQSACSVDADGWVTGLRAGTCAVHGFVIGIDNQTITEATAPATIFVTAAPTATPTPQPTPTATPTPTPQPTPAPIASLKVSPGSATLKVGQCKQFTLADQLARPVVVAAWVSNNPARVSIRNGLACVTSGGFKTTTVYAALGALQSDRATIKLK